MALTRGFVDSLFQEPLFSGGRLMSPWPSLALAARPTSEQAAALSAWKPSTDVRETANEFIISAAIPGAKKEDVSVELEGNVLRISGTVQDELREDNERHYYVERSYGEFARAFTLPPQADTAAIKAEHKDGVLCVHVPKIKEKKQEAKRIGVD